MLARYVSQSTKLHAAPRPAGWIRETVTRIAEVQNTSTDKTETRQCVPPTGFRKHSPRLTVCALISGLKITSHTQEWHGYHARRKARVHAVGQSELEPQSRLAKRGGSCGDTLQKADFTESTVKSIDSTHGKGTNWIAHKCRLQ